MKKFLCFAATMLLANLALAQTACFNSTASTYSLATGPAIVSVKTTDLNNNGQPDIVTADNNGANSVSVFLDYNGTSFASTTTYTLSFPGATVDVSIADFDGDGNLDVATVNNYTVNAVSIFQGNGTGTLTYNSSYNAGSGPKAGAIGDFNGDAKIDIAVVNATGNNLTILNNSSAGTGLFSFTAGGTISTGSLSSPCGIVAKDLDNANGLDLVVISSAASNNIATYLNNGSGSFTFLSNYSAGTYPTGIASADFNQDGYVDIAISNGSSNNISVLLGTSGAAFGPATNYAMGSYSAKAITVNDFNNDGIFDLAATDWGTMEDIFIWQGSGSGTFGTPTSFSYSGGTPVSLASGDLTGDGLADFAVASSSNNLYIFTNTNPVVTVSGNTTICAGGTTTLTAAGAATYSWSTGSTATSISSSPSSTTSFTVVGTSGTCATQAVVTVTVNPVPSVTANSATICAGATATLTATGATTYTWSPGGVTNNTYVVTPSSTTAYTVTGTNSFGCSATATTVVIVNANPAINITSNSPVCSGQALTFTNTTAGASTYLWNTPSGPTSTLTNYSVGSASASDAGTYTLTATSAAGCVATGTAAVTVVTNPTLTVNSGTICAGASLTLTASGATSYTWTPGGSTSSSLVVSPSSSTVYTVIGTAGSCTAATTGTVVVNALPSVSANSSTICIGSTATLTATGANTYVWNTGATTVNISVTPTVTTQYTVTGTDVNGCTGTATADVTVNINNNLSGMVYDTTTVTGPHPITAGYVYLYNQQPPPLAAVVVDSAQITVSGYTVQQVPGGNYYVKAVADISAYPGSVPTYYSSSANAYQWDSAAVITQIGCATTANTGRDITIIETPAATGMGVISGTITADSSYGGRYGSGHIGVMGAPLKGIDVKLGRNPGGSAAARTTTNNSGVYTFTAVNDGSYSIYADIPNYGMVNVLTVTISPSNPQSVNNDYCVDSVAIYACSAANNIHSVNGNEYLVKIFPNPGRGPLSVQVGTGWENMTADVYSIVGQKVLGQPLRGELSSLDVSALDEGVYIVRILKNGVPVYQERFIKQQ